jgi:hypothetical protein
VACPLDTTLEEPADQSFLLWVWPAWLCLACVQVADIEGLVAGMVTKTEQLICEFLVDRPLLIRTLVCHP